MPQKSRRAHLAKAQCTSGTQFLGNSFLDDVNEHVLVGGQHYDKATPTLRDTPEGQVDRI